MGRERKQRSVRFILECFRFVVKAITLKYLITSLSAGSSLANLKTFLAKSTYLRPILTITKRVRSLSLLFTFAFGETFKGLLI